MLALDVGREYVRGAISDFAGAVRVRDTLPTRAKTRRGRVAELGRLAERLTGRIGLELGRRHAIRARQPWRVRPSAATRCRSPARSRAGTTPSCCATCATSSATSLMIENDVDAAALAERAHGHGREVESFAFVSIGTGIGMGLVLDGRLRRGAHGAAGEIAYLPLEDERRRSGGRAPPGRARSGGFGRGHRAGGAAGRAGAGRVRPAGVRRGRRAATSARSGVVAAEALLVARAICSVVAVVDPDLVVLGGGIGAADGLVDAVRTELDRLAPVPTELRVSALGVGFGRRRLSGQRAGPGLVDAHVRRPRLTRYVVAADGGNSKTDLVLASVDGDDARAGGRRRHAAGASTG